MDLVGHRQASPHGQKTPPESTVHVSATAKTRRFGLGECHGLGDRALTEASGQYADIVFFADETAVEQVMAAEQTSEVCHQFMSLWDGDEPVMYRVLQIHE